MVHNDLFVKCLKFLLVFSQVSIACCQLEESHQDPLNHDEQIPKFKLSELENYEMNSNTQNNNKALSDISGSLDGGDMVFGENKDMMNNHDYIDDYIIFKRDAQEHSKSGQKKKITKKNKTVQGRILKLHKDRIKNKETRRKLKMLEHKRFKELFNSKIDEKIKNDKNKHMLKSNANHNNKNPLSVLKTKAKDLNMPSLSIQKDSHQKDISNEEMKELINATRYMPIVKSRDLNSNEQTQRGGNSSAFIEIIDENPEKLSKWQKSSRRGVFHKAHYTSEQRDVTDKDYTLKTSKNQPKVVKPSHADPNVNENPHTSNKILPDTDLYVPKTYKASKSRLQHISPENEKSAKLKSTVLTQSMQTASKNQKHAVEELTRNKGWDPNSEGSSNANEKETSVSDEYRIASNNQKLPVDELISNKDWNSNSEENSNTNEKENTVPDTYHKDSKTQKCDVEELNHNKDWDVSSGDKTNTNEKENNMADDYHNQKLSSNKGSAKEQSKFSVSGSIKEYSSDNNDNISDENNRNPSNEDYNNTYFKVYALGVEDTKNSENSEDQNYQVQTKVFSQISPKHTFERLTNKKHANRAKTKTQPRETLDLETSNKYSENTPKDMKGGGKNKRLERDINRRNHKRVKSTAERLFGYPQSEEYNYGKEQEDGLNSEENGESKITNYRGSKRRIHRPIEDYSDDGENDEEENIDSNNRFRKQFARRSHVAKLFGNEDGKENCADSYKEKTTNKETLGTNSTTTEKGFSTATSSKTAESTSTPAITTCSLKQTSSNDKTKTTPKIKTKTPPPKKAQNEGRNDSSSTRVLGTFEQFLCGQLADDFVSAVLAKVKRSRKMYKELGFQNDTDETCDRCIETKSNKMPSLETMKTSLEKCSDKNEQDKNCLTCYSVPKPMERFLNLLISYEQEIENNAYNKIRDDSSFIFTGDYTDQLTRSENSLENNDKYIGDSNYFNKDTFEKQHLRDENSEEKADGQSSNRHPSENTKQNVPIEEKSAEEYSTENVVGDVKDKHDKYEIESDARKETFENEPKDKDQFKSTLDIDEELKANDIVEEFDNNVPFNNKYSYYTDTGLDETGERVLSSNPVRRRKAYKNDILQNSKNTGVPGTGGTKVETNIDTKTNKKRNFVVMDHGPLKTIANQHNGGQQYVHSKPSGYNNLKPQFSNSRQYINNWSYNDDKVSTAHLTPNDKYSNSKTNNFLHSYYPSEDYVDSNNHNRNGNNNKFHSANSDWERNNYQPLLNQPGRSSMEHNSLKQKYYGVDYDGSLDMVKRNTDPIYEDEPLFIEVPDIEYDLY